MTTTLKPSFSISPLPHLMYGNPTSFLSDLCTTLLLMTISSFFSSASFSSSSHPLNRSLTLPNSLSFSSYSCTFSSSSFHTPHLNRYPASFSSLGTLPISPFPSPVALSSHHTRYPSSFCSCWRSSTRNLALPRLTISSVAC